MDKEFLLIFDALLFLEVMGDEAEAERLFKEMIELL